MSGSNLQKLLADKARKEMLENILPFWTNVVLDKENGGFYGIVTNDLTIDKTAPKGGILNSRILWTFSQAFRIFKESGYLKIAGLAYDFLVKCFWDYEYGGIYWMADYKGNVIDAHKQMYNIAFGIYGLSEYYMASRNPESLERAIQLFRITEEKSYDHVNRGYFEAYSREWLPMDDNRLSDKDINEKKSMNTHLHILEAYTNLARVWDSPELKVKLKELIEVMLELVLNNDNHHFKLFFDEWWNLKSGAISYGHDIEGSWLLCEAANILGDAKLSCKVEEVAVKMADAVYREALDNEYGGIFNEMHTDGHLDTDKPWWPQAEAVVGFLNAYELTGEERFLDAAFNTWKFIRNYVSDSKLGEWFSVVSREGKPFYELPKVEPWKCPYHNGRACMEIITRLENYL